MTNNSCRFEELVFLWEIGYYTVAFQFRTKVLPTPKGVFPF